MAEPQPERPRYFDAPADHPLIGIPFEEDGREMVRYFTDEEALDEAFPGGVQRALSLIGAWKDLGSWEEVEAELDRIRHESTPTPAIDDL